MKSKTSFLDNPTFDGVLVSGRKTGGVYITLASGEYVKCECRKKGKKANIAFDLYTRSCNHDLSPEAQQWLYNEHKAYIHGRFAGAGYTGSVHCTFSGTVIYFDVLPQDAEDWFQTILATLNKSGNMVDVKPQLLRVA